MRSVFPPVDLGGVTDGDVLTVDLSAPRKMVWATPGAGPGGGAPDDATYVVVSLDATLTDERRLQVGTGLSLTDGGAGGDITVGLDADLVALASNATDGFWAHTGAGTGAARTLQAPAAGITISNPAGVAGDPTFALANDLAAIEALATTGIAVRSAASTWITRAITAGGGIVVTNGDGVAGAPTIATSAESFVVTSAGYTTVTLPADSRAVGFRCKGSGGGGGGGTTGTNAANRAGGGGGGPSAGMSGIADRGLFDTSVEVYVGAAAAGGTPGGAADQGLISLVEITNTGYAGTTTPQASSTVVYSGGRAQIGVQGSLGGGAGNGGSTPTVQQALFAREMWGVTLQSAGNGTAGGASGTPADLSPFSGTSGPSCGGCGGAGKNAVPTAADGGKHAAFGHLAATVGGVNPGGGGNTPAGIIGSTVDRQLAYYGGTGGASHTAGTGGNGGDGEQSCGGGGGGAGTTAGGDGGDSGPGFVVVRVFG